MTSDELKEHFDLKRLNGYVNMKNERKVWLAKKKEEEIEDAYRREASSSRSRS